jgi:hypothetical protein
MYFTLQTNLLYSQQNLHASLSPIVEKKASSTQQVINQQNNPDSFRNYYAMFVNDPNSLGSPRQIRLGVRYDF